MSVLLIWSRSCRHLVSYSELGLFPNSASGFLAAFLGHVHSTFRKLRFDRSSATTVLLSLASAEHALSHPGYTLFSPSSHTHFFKDLQGILKVSLYSPLLNSIRPTLSHHHSHPKSPCGLCGINSVSFLMQSCEKNGLKDTILQKLEKSYTTLSTWQQFCRGAKKRREIRPCSFLKIDRTACEQE